MDTNRTPSTVPRPAGGEGAALLDALIDCLFDLPPHRSSIPQVLATRNPHDVVPLRGQILVAAMIMLAVFVGLMMLTIDLNDQLQCHATEIDGVRRDGVFTTKLLAATTTIPQHLPNVLRKVDRGGSLITSKLDRVMVTLQSSVHIAPVTGRCRLLAPHPQPFSPFHEGEQHSPSWKGEKGASLEQAGHGVEIANPHSINHRTQFEFRPRAHRLDHSRRRWNSANCGRWNR